MARAQIYNGRARIKDGKARVGPDDSCCCGGGRIITCSEILTGFSTLSLQFESSGWADGPATYYDCDNCSDFNSAFVFPYLSNYISSSAPVWNSGGTSLTTAVTSGPRFSLSGLGKLCTPTGEVGNASMYALFACAFGKINLSMGWFNGVNNYALVYSVPLADVEVGKLYTAGWVPDPGSTTPPNPTGITGPAPPTCDWSGIVINWKLIE